MSGLSQQLGWVVGARLTDADVRLCNAQKCFKADHHSSASSMPEQDADLAHT